LLDAYSSEYSDYYMTFHISKTTTVIMPMTVIMTITTMAVTEIIR